MYYNDPTEELPLISILVIRCIKKEFEIDIFPAQNTENIHLQFHVTLKQH